MDEVRLSSGEAFSLRRAGLIGAGRVGRAFGRVLAKRGFEITAVAARSPESAAAAADELGSVVSDAAGVAREGGLVVVAVPDDALESVIGSIASEIAPDTWVVHTCGRSGIAPLAACGERVAAVHPAAPIAADSTLDGIAFGVTCSEPAWPFAQWLVSELGGFPVRIPEEDRPLYHAALVMASNFVTALAADAFSLASPEMILPLVRSTIDNLERMTPSDALTGPVVRGDAGTVRAHIDALASGAPQLREAYVAVSRRLIAHARASGRLDDAAAERVETELLR